jgi:uncharacterized protein (DUF2164 family)
MENSPFNIPAPPKHILDTWAMDTYQKQRKDRLSDAIGDYLTDEDTTSAEFYIELKEEIQCWIDYHQKFLRKAQDIQALVNGHQPMSEFALGDK